VDKDKFKMKKTMILEIIMMQDMMNGLDMKDHYLQIWNMMMKIEKLMQYIIWLINIWIQEEKKRRE